MNDNFSELENNKKQSVFLIELDKIKPNPYQPRISFDEEKLKALSESIQQYGVLQPIVVTRKERYQEGIGITFEYEIIAGERRFRASKLAGLKQIPAIIRTGEQTDSEKLELAIIENLQREDLNPIDKAKAFKKLTDEFGMKHSDIASKMGKSREFVSNALRLLLLPDIIQEAVISKRISEGHTRPLLMLKDRPEEQMSLFRKIITNRLTVRSAETVAREIATDKIRKKEFIDPEIKAVETKLSEKLGTKVLIEKKQTSDSGKITIEFFSKDDLKAILAAIKSNNNKNNQPVSLMEKLVASSISVQSQPQSTTPEQESITIDQSITKPTQPTQPTQPVKNEDSSLYDAFLKSRQKMEEEEKIQRIRASQEKLATSHIGDEEDINQELQIEDIPVPTAVIDKDFIGEKVSIDNTVFEKIEKTIKDKEPETYTVMRQEENKEIEGVEVAPVVSGSDFLSAKTEVEELDKNIAEESQKEEEYNPDDLYGFKGFSV